MRWSLDKTFPVGSRGMVAAKHPLAAQAGVEILRQGGAAVDAAIATSFASGVVEPYMSGVGGGGLAVHAPAGSTPMAIHCGMRAPASAQPNMYEVIPGTQDLDLFGWPRTEGDANVLGPPSVAVPGLVPGLRLLWQRGGRLPWEALLQPAIELAARGFLTDWLTSLRILNGFDLLSRFPESRAIFLARGRPPRPDLGLGAEVLRQMDLSESLKELAEDPDAMRRGRIVNALTSATEGRIVEADVGSRRPLCGDSLQVSFAGLDIHLVPWATGGPTVAEWLSVMQHLDPPRDADNPDLWAAIVGAGRVAMHDRLHSLADPDFAPFPQEILDSGYHARAAASVRAGEIGPVVPGVDHGSTSHLCAVDAMGNVVSLTQTLLSVWGSGIVAPGTGICLNNGMMWFNPEPGTPNSVEAGKVPLANMCPVVASRDSAPILAFGASGGRRILGAIVQILVRVALLGQSLAEAMAAPRLDISTGPVVMDARFGNELGEELSRRLGERVHLLEPSLGASYWASPVGVMQLEDGRWTGGGDLNTLACVLEV